MTETNETVKTERTTDQAETVGRVTAKTSDTNVRFVSTGSHQQARINRLVSTSSFQQARFNKLVSTSSFQQARFNRVENVASCVFVVEPDTRVARVGNNVGQQNWSVDRQW